MSAIEPSSLEGPSAQALNSTFGVLFIGFILSVTLYGLTFFQTHVFLAKFHAENPWIKCMVTLLWLIDTATTSLVSHIQYFYLIESFSLPFDELELTRTFVAEKALATIATLIVQSFWVYRLRASARKWRPSAILISLLIVVSFGFGIASIFELAKRRYIAQLITPRFEVLTSAYEGLAFVCNLLIVVTNFTLFGWKPKPNSGIGQHWFDGFVLVLVNRGTSVAILQLILFLTFVITPYGQLWILWHFVISKCYINSVVSMLNSRRAHGGIGIFEDEDSLEPQQPQKAALHPPSIGHARRPQRQDDLSILTFTRTEFTNYDVNLATTVSVDEDTELDGDVEGAKSASHASTPTTPVSPHKLAV